MTGLASALALSAIRPGRGTSRMGLKRQTAGKAIPELDGQPDPIWNGSVTCEMPAA
jgi:hypothetical protein